MESRRMGNAEFEVLLINLGVTNERHVDGHQLTVSNPLVARMREQGLDHFLRRNQGYNIHLVRAFYSNIEVPPKDQPGAPIFSQVGNTRITVTPDAIAEYLRYDRPNPDDVIYAHDIELSRAEVHTEMYEDRKVRWGMNEVDALRYKYALALQFIAYSLAPRTLEIPPDETLMDLVYLFFDKYCVFDWAQFIFDQIVLFRTDIGRYPRMPFPCLLQGLCLSQGVSVDRYPRCIGFSPGVINRGVANELMEGRPDQDIGDEDGDERTWDVPYRW